MRTYISFLLAICLGSPAVHAGGEKNRIVPVPITSQKGVPAPVVSHQQAPARTHQASLLEILPGESASFLSPSGVPSALVTPSTLAEITGQPRETFPRQKNKRPVGKDKLKAIFARIRKPHAQPELNPHNLEGWTPSVVDIAPSELNGYLPDKPVPSLTAPATESGFYSGAYDELQASDSVSVIGHEQTSLIPPSLCNALLPSLLPHFSSVEQQDDSVPATPSSPAKPSGFANLKLETVSADTSPFPALIPASGQALMAFSPAMKKLAEIVQQGQNPLREKGRLSCFLRSLPDETESYRVGSHSLVIKRRDAPGHVAKIARCNTRDARRFRQELQLYQYIRKPGMELLALNTCPLLKTFIFAGRPVLVMEQIDFIADQQLLLIKDRSLSDRLDFALTWLWRFCDVYRLFLEHGILLADRHGGNIGFNETRLLPIPKLDFPCATLRIPVMLDLDPYWKDDTETTLRLNLPTWIPVAMDLLERAFRPGEIDDGRRNIHNHLRRLAMPAEHTQAERQTEQCQGVENLASESITFWLSGQEESSLKDEAKLWLPQLFTLSEEFQDKARTVRKWTEVLQAETERIITILNQWKACSRFGFMEDCRRAKSVTAPLAPHLNRQEDNASQLQAFSRTLLARTHAEVKCDQCSRCFRSLNEYNSHYKNHALNRLKVCYVCDGGYSHLKPHLRKHTGEKPFKCKHPGCSKCFSDSSALINHRRIHSGEKPFECKHCGKGYTVKSTLINHLRTHTGEKPFECPYQGCHKEFVQRGGLAKHLRTHTGDKPYKCKYPGCGKAFSQTIGLTKHLRTHTGEKPYKCQDCGNEFSLQVSLKKHLRTHTGEKPYKCEYPDCNKAFSQKIELTTHRYIHTGEKPYKCEICGREFTRQFTLNTHLRIHTGEKPYTCDVCGNGFSQSGSRNKHQKKCGKKKTLRSA